MRPDSLYSRKQRFTYEDLSDDDSKLLLLQDSLKILNLKRNLAKDCKKHTNDRRPSNEHGVGNCAQCILSSALKTVSKFNESYRKVGEFCCNMDTNVCGV